MSYESLIGYQGRNGRSAMPSIGQVSDAQVADALAVLSQSGGAGGLGWPYGGLACGPDTQAIARQAICAPRCYDTFLGFEPTWLCPDECVVIRTCPVPVAFTANKLLLPPNVAAFVAFSSIKFALTEFILCGEIPGAVFSTDNECCCDLGGMQIPPGISATISITNTSNAKIKFRGSFCGSAIVCGT